MHEVPRWSIDDAIGLLSATAAGISTLDLSRLDPLELDEIVAAGRLVERAVAALLLRAAHQAADLAAAGEGPGPDAILGGRGAVSASLARAEACRASAAGVMPSFASALAEGAVGTGHLDAVARALHQAPEPEREALAAHERSLLDAARRLSVDSFGRHLGRVLQRVREQVGTANEPPEAELRLWQGRGGVGRLAGTFGAEEFELIRSAVEAEMARLCRRSDESPEVIDGATAPVSLDGRLAAHALVSRLTAPTAAAPVGRPSITLVVDAATLVEGAAHDATVCETDSGVPVPVATAQRCACDAVIRKVVLDERGVPVDVGRRFRTATDAQWAALRAMYTGCAWFGCNRPLNWCQAHHVIHWTPPHNGPTDLANLVPLCSAHHHLAHEGGWQLVLDADRALHLHQPDGTRWRTATPHRWVDGRDCPPPADNGHWPASCPPPADTARARAGRAAA